MKARRVHFFSERVLLAGFLALLSLPLADTYLRLDRTPPPEEQRLLAQFPLWTDASNLVAYVRRLDAYFNDHLGYRNYFIKWYHKRRRMVFGAERSADGQVLVGKDGWLYYALNNMVENHRATTPFSDEDLRTWVRAFERRRDWLRARGIRFLVVVAPNKETIYPEYLPDWLHRVGRESRKDQVVRVLRERANIEVVDLERPLLRTKPTRRAFSKTDSHWNDAGAFVAYREIARALAQWFPDVRPMTETNVRLVEERKPAGDLANCIGLGNQMEENVPVATPVMVATPRSATPPSLTAEQAGQREFPPIAFETPGRRVRCLLLRDSFMEALRPFLTPHFGRCLYLYTMYLDAEVIEKEKPDIVIHQMVERHLATTVPGDFERRDRLP